MTMRREPASGASLALIGAFFLVATVAGAEPPGKATTTTDRGLHTTTFHTTRGAVEVHLPDDLAAGDTISGTVVARPTGPTPAAARKNGDRLRGYVVEIEEQEAEVRSGALSWTVPAAAAAAAVLVLRDSRGREVARGRVPVAPAAPPSTAGGMTIPPHGQTGRPVTIGGTFNGRFDDSGVTIGGREARLLAESPRRLVVESPVDVVGPTTIVVREAETTSEQPYHNIQVTLSAPRTELGRGESTTLTMEVAGLAGLGQPLPVLLRNLMPAVVALEGGDVQTISIAPAEAGTDGRFVVTRRVHGVGVGAFDIAARVPSRDEVRLQEPREPEPGQPSRPATPQPAQPASPQPSQPATPQPAQPANPRPGPQQQPAQPAPPGPPPVLIQDPPDSEKCCCPKSLEILYSGPLKGPRRISDYWPSVFPVWGERVGPGPDEISNDDSLGYTEVPQLFVSQLRVGKDSYRNLAGLPTRPEEGVPAGAKNIGARYQMIVEYSWRRSADYLSCTFHWEKANDRTGWRFVPDVAPDKLYDYSKTIGNTRYPESHLWTDTPQRVHLPGQDPRGATLFRWWIESDPACGCDPDFIGEEAAITFRIPGGRNFMGPDEYAEPSWQNVRKVESETDFTPPP